MFYRFLQQNCIQTIENLGALVKLDTLNVSNNLIKRLDTDSFANLSAINTLQISHNFLQSKQDIQVLAECKSLSVLDLSHNKLDDVGVIEVLELMPQLAVLNLMHNPVIRLVQSYRRVLISRCKALTYLDDRPVFDKERLATEAWAIGGVEAERAERQRQHDAEIEEQNRNFEAMKRLQERGRARRLMNYGPESLEHDSQFSGRLLQFRDEQLARIDGGPSTTEIVEILASEGDNVESQASFIQNNVPYAPSAEDLTSLVEKKHSVQSVAPHKPPLETPSSNLLEEVFEEEVDSFKQVAIEDRQENDMKYYVRPTEQALVDKSLLPELASYNTKQEEFESMETLLSKAPVASFNLGDSQKTLIEELCEDGQDVDEIHVGEEGAATKSGNAKKVWE